MDLSNSIISFIDLLGVVQGLLFGIILFFLHFKKNKSTLFLGLFIILFSLEPVPNILNDLGILLKYPQLELLPVGFHFLAYPCFLVYIEKVSIMGDKKTSIWTLIPGFVEFLIALIVFLLPSELKLEVKDSLFAGFYFFSGLCYTLYISYLILKRIYTHAKEVENQYSYVQSKTLNWSKWFIYFSVFFHLLILSNFFLMSHVWYAWISVLNVVLIYWVSFKGITQENIVALIWFEEIKEVSSKMDVLEKKESSKIDDIEVPPLNLTSQISQSLMTKKEANELYDLIENYVQESKCYVNDTLTIIDVAEALNIHPKRISYTINTIKSINFNNYINAFRVELAKEILKSNKGRTLSIEGVGIEAGFHSKTTFYNAFKKNVNMTPAKYKASLISK